MIVEGEYPSSAYYTVKFSGYGFITGTYFPIIEFKKKTRALDTAFLFFIFFFIKNGFIYICISFNMSIARPVPTRCIEIVFMYSICFDTFEKLYQICNRVRIVIIVFYMLVY